MAPEELLIKNATGVVLAGGRSSRFGTDKALALLDDRPLIRHVADGLRDLFPSCIISANSAGAYEFLGLPVVSDRYTDQGPLSGIHASLHAISTPWAFVTACDMPHQNSALIRYLWSLAQLPSSPAVVLPCSQRGPEPLYGFYHRRILPVLERRLRRQQNRLRDVLEELQPRLVSMEEMPPECRDPATFDNVNRPEELPKRQQGE